MLMMVRGAGGSIKRNEGRGRGGGGTVNSFGPSTAFITLPSKPNSVQLSDTPTYALQAKIHRCAEKSVYDTSNL